MNKNFKKVLVVLLSALMVFTYMPTMAFAANGYDYTVTTAIPDQTYTGEAPDLMALPELAEVTTAEGTNLLRGVDFEVSTEDYHVGTGTATFVGKGNYADKTFEPKTFTIKDAPVAHTYTAELDTSKFVYGYEVNKANVQAAAKVIMDGNTRLTNDQYDVAITAPTGATGAVGEKYTVKIFVGNATKPDFSQEFTVTIAKKDLKDATVEATVAAATYDGTAQQPAVSAVTADGVTLAATDYTVTYKDNTNASDKAVATITATSACKNFTGSYDKKFTIAPAELGSATRLVVEGKTVVYNGKNQQPELTLKAYFKDAVDAKLIPADDYEIVYPETSKDVQTADYQISIKAKTDGNLTGESGKVNAYKITPASLKDVTITAKKDTIPAGVDVTTNFKKYYSVKLGDQELVQGTDYIVAYKTDNHDTVGRECVVELTAASDNFVAADKATVSYTTGAKEFVKYYVAEYRPVYNGSAQRPAASDLGAIYPIDEETGMPSEADSVIPADYIAIDWSNNINATLFDDDYSIDKLIQIAAKATIEGKNEHKGQTATVLFMIAPKNISTFTIAAKDVSGLNAGNYYEGQEITGVSVTNAANPLKADECYAEINSIEQGYITAITIYGTGNYTGSKEVTGLHVAASPASLNNATVSTTIPAGLDEYTADSIKDHLTVTVGGNEIAPDVYELSIVTAPSKYEVGAKVVVELTAGTQISGSKEVTLTLVQRDVKDFEEALYISNPWGYYYTGKAIEPLLGSEVEDWIEDDIDEWVTSFKKDTDYTLSYKNNVDAGTATVTVTGKGNYTGSVDITFEIEKEWADELYYDDDIVAVLPPESVRQFKVGPVDDLSSQFSFKAATGRSYKFTTDDYTIALKDPKQEVKSTDKITDPITVTYVVTVKSSSKNYRSEYKEWDSEAEEYVTEPITFEVSYDLVAKTVRNAQVTLEKSTFEHESDDIQAYKSKIGKVTVVVDGQTLTEGTDYTWDVKGTGKVPSQYAAGDKAPYVEIDFKGNYTGVDTSAKLTIVTAIIDVTQIKLVPPAAKDMEYTGESLASKIVANDLEAGTDKELPEGSWEIVFSQDGKEIPAADVKNAGTYKATVRTTPDYGSIEGDSIEFTVTPRTLTTAEFNAMVAALEVGDVEYLAEATKAPELEGEYADQFEVVSYDKEWDGEAKQGKAVVALKADANYKYDGTAEVKFDWEKGFIYGQDVNDWFEIAPQTYTGMNLEPAVTAKADLSVDYVDIKYYENNVNSGIKTAKAYVVVTVPNADKKYQGYMQGYIVFTINPAGDLKVEVEDATYTGKALEPAVTVKNAQGILLDLDKDYTVAYADNTNAGKGKVTVTAMGNYAGTFEAEFTIAKAKNTMTVKAKAVKAKAKKTTKLAAKKVFTVKKAQGKVTYKLAKKVKNVKLAKNGKLTVKKGLKKGKTIKVKVKVTAAGNANYKKLVKTVTVKVKIK